MKTLLQVKQHIMICMLCIALQGMALPADNTPRVITLPDGSTLTVVLHGDEYGSYMTTLDGKIVELCDDGYYRYSQMQGERCVATDIIARDNV
ncbi:MAG: peptidase M6, partial [Bacteroidaceae bacterium]|nr:peptidase M6 [Bacteroidaceae bacterium]